MSMTRYLSIFAMIASASIVVQPTTLAVRSNAGAGT
jgi:hypothetical protein